MIDIDRTTSDATHERVPVLRIPGDRPPARRGGPGGASSALDAGTDHGHELHELIRMGRLQGRSGKTHGALVRPSPLSGELGLAPAHDPHAEAARRSAAPRRLPREG